MISSMKKTFAIISILTLGIVSCSSCARKTPDPSTPAPAPPVTVTPVPPTPVPTTTVIKQDNVEFTLPTDEWKKLESPPSHSVALINPVKKNIIVFVNEDFSGTYEQYVLVALRGVKDAGANVASAKQTEVNGHKFVLIESSKNGMRVWMWVTLLNNHGYGFSCGGPDGDTTQRDLCSNIMGTLKIN